MTIPPVGLRITVPIILLLFVFGCTKPVVREAPSSPDRTVSLGTYALSATTLDFTPYFDLTTLLFVDENGVEYTFQMGQPIVRETYSYLRTYPNPEPPGEFVLYRYVGKYVLFDFISNELGARLSVSLESDFCEDPLLDETMLPENHLQIRGVGFNDGDVGLTAPALAVVTETNRPCGQGRRLGDVQLGDRTFTNVTSHRQTLGDRYLEVYYSPEFGVVALGTSYFFLVLKEAY